MQRTNIQIETRIALLYALFGGLWILFSDSLLNLLIPDLALYARIQTYKGWLFVAASALLIFSLIRQEIARRTETVTKLRASEEQYRELFEHMTEGYAYCKMLFEDGQAVDWIYLTVNEAFARLTGLKQVIGKRVTEVIPGIRASAPELFETYARVALTGKPEKFETYLAALDMWFSVSVYSPELEYFVAVFDVITERKRAEEALRRYELLSEHSRDIILFMRREDGRILEANAAAAQAYGYSRDELLGLSIQDLRAPDTQGLTAEQMAQADAGGLLFETVHRRRDGRAFPVEVSSQGATIGGLRTLVSIVRDISARKQAEEEIEILSKFPTENPNPVLRVGTDGLLTYANPASRELLELWGCDTGCHVPAEINLLIDTAAETGSTTSVDILCNDKVYSFILVPVLKSGYVNLYGRDITGYKQADIALRESEQRYRGLFESMQEGLVAAEVLSDENGVPIDYRYLDVNPATERQFGLPREQFIGRRYTEALPEGDPEWIDIFGRVASTGEPLSLERFGMASKRWFECHVYSPRPGQVINITTDITERKQAEAALRESEQRLNRAQEIAHLGSWELDLINNKLTWSDEAYRIFGLQPQEFGASYEAFLEAVHPDDRAAVDAAYSGSIREGRDSYEIEHRVVGRPSGEIRFVHEKCEHFRDESGQIVRSVGMVHDITERRLMEQALLDSEAHYRGLVESQLDLIVRVDPEGRFTFVNDAYCQKFGLKREEILGRDTYQPLVHPEDLPHTLEAMKALYRPPYRAIMEQRAFAVEGIRWIEWQDSTIRDETGKIVEIQAIGRDITERKRAEEELHRTLEELKRSNAELEQFAYVASHDLQEPLRGIAGLVQVLQQRYQGQLDERADEYITHIVEGTQRMQTLINDLLAYSRIGRRGEAIQPTPAEAALNATLQNLSAAIQEYGATVTSESLPTVKADATQLIQLFQNLIGNAIKFRAERPPHIHVSVAEAGDCWQFSVRDNGIGIEPQYFERIFQVFQRLHTLRQYKGTGIGLAICKKILDRHGGHIWVESEPGQGSTFYFTLPKGD